VIFPHLDAETRRALEGFLRLIDRTFPLPRRRAGSLPRDIAELSRLFTGARGERTVTYLGKPAFLSAYLRYFLPWNLYRLCRLLPGLVLPLEDGDAVTDLGSGPLSLALALWISRPDLRGLRLEFRCIDHTATVMRAGKKLFEALAGGDCPWILRLERNSLGGRAGKAPIVWKGPSAEEKQPAGKDARRQEKPARLVTAVNVFTELGQNIPAADGGGLKRFAEKSFKTLTSYLADTGYLLAVEPGNPQGGAFIAGLRGALIESGGSVLAPCPHAQPCPFPGGKAPRRERRTEGRGKGKWCHFAFSTEEAPAALRTLSSRAGLPKERAALSFLFAGLGGQEGPEPEALTGGLRLRVISDAFPLPAAGGAPAARDARFGRYCCSEQGMALLTGKRSALEKAESGALFKAACTGARDPKTGAVIAEI
jgi:hypothetical protein